MSNIPPDDDESYVKLYSTAGVLETTLSPSDPLNGNDFRRYFDIDGDTIAVGAPGGEHGISTGAVYVFKLENEVWNESKIVVPVDKPASMFGRGVALSGNTLIIGAPTTDLPNDLREAGAVYVYNYENGRGSRPQRNNPPLPQTRRSH